jgi:hypothetical protein
MTTLLHVLRNTTWSLILAAGISTLVWTDGFWQLAWANWGQVFSVGAFGMSCGCGCGGCTKADCTSLETVTVTVSGTSGTHCSGRPCATDFDGTFVLTGHTSNPALGTACAGITDTNRCQFGDGTGGALPVYTCGPTAFYIQAWLVNNGSTNRWVVKITSVFFGGNDRATYRTASTTTPCADRTATLNRVVDVACPDTAYTCTFPATVDLS